MLFIQDNGEKRMQAQVPLYPSIYVKRTTYSAISGNFWIHKSQPYPRQWRFL